MSDHNPLFGDPLLSKLEKGEHWRCVEPLIAGVIVGQLVVFERVNLLPNGYQVVFSTDQEFTIDLHEFFKAFRLDHSRNA